MHRKTPPNQCQRYLDPNIIHIVSWRRWRCHFTLSRSFIGISISSGIFIFIIIRRSRLSGIEFSQCSTDDTIVHHLDDDDGYSVMDVSASTFGSNSSLDSQVQQEIATMSDLQQNFIEVLSASLRDPSTNSRNDWDNKNSRVWNDILMKYSGRIHTRQMTHNDYFTFFNTNLTPFLLTASSIFKTTLTMKNSLGQTFPWNNA